jgi:hypothetical protein
MWHGCVRERWPGALKKGEVVSCRDVARVDWRWSTANMSRRKRTNMAAGLRPKVYEGGTRSEARGHARRWSVGSERGRRSCTCQVFDGMSSNRAVSSEAARNTTKSKACMVRLKDVKGRLVAR